MAMEALRIGVLNLMHDKEATRRRFTRVLEQPGLPVKLTFFYPVTHYTGRPVPEAVAKIARPLDLELAAQMDGFIITGAPIENLPFDQVEYFAEVCDLIDVLNRARVFQLYVCWGAMVAANYLYGVEKHRLAKKYFGVFENQVVAPDPLLVGLEPNFLAPHARYAELNEGELAPKMVVTARSSEGYLLAARATAYQSFLFAHLEYGQNALLEEYQREVAAHPTRHYQKPVHYFKDEGRMQGPKFRWRATQQRYFANWLNLVATKRLLGVCKVS
ncbi:homoserine O-acetyltransferase/O-succinyltransferase family protein [Limosilactobacillus fermentum]|uniref:Serine O-acetyltransferase n=1 Tax=Limosilactobacillus fermentum TaxID=1613 RepID=A0A2K2TL20_LIMFE|nr:homoserine O-succinyltransferase [Limosilactobacillus fermentum]PNV58700.1 homoserine O-succinyltransferase [Limosilactobacillus fermentum]